MTGILLNHLPRSHSRTMLLAEIRGLFPKITRGKNRSICFHNGTTVFSIRTVLSGGKLSPVFPHKWKALQFQSQQTAWYAPYLS